MAFVAGVRVTTYIPSMETLKTELKLHVTKIESTSKQINTFATQYAHFMLVYFNKYYKIDKSSQTSTTFLKS